MSKDMQKHIGLLPYQRSPIKITYSPPTGRKESVSVRWRTAETPSFSEIQK